MNHLFSQKVIWMKNGNSRKRGRKASFVQSEESWGSCCYTWLDRWESTHPPKANVPQRTLDLPRNPLCMLVSKTIEPPFCPFVVLKSEPL